MSRLSRRAFIAGSCAVVAASAFEFSACSKKVKADDNNKIITAVLSHQSSDCNPIANASSLFWSAGWHVYEGLYDIDYSDYSTYNGLAAMKPIKITNTKYQIVLRDGARFSNGQQVLANDVVNAFNKNMQDQLFSVLLAPILNLCAITDKKIEINLKYPFDEYLEKRLAIVKVFPANLPESELNTMPIGSGPWLYESIDGSDGGILSFVPNSYYNGQFCTNASKMDWRIICDDAARTAELSAKNVATCENLYLPDKEKAKISGANVSSSESACQVFLCFNCLKAPFDDKRVRQAIHYAIDTDKLINEIMNGYGSAASCILPDNHSSYHCASSVYNYNSGKAKELLRQAGVSNLELTLLVSSAFSSSFSEIIKNNLSKVGITVNVEQANINWDDYSERDDVFPFDAILTSADPSMFGNDPDLITSYWYDNNAWMRGRSCYAKSKNNKYPEIRSTIQLARETTASESQKYLNSCFDLIAEECPIYPLLHRWISTGYYSEALNNFKPISTTGLNFVTSIE